MRVIPFSEIRLRNDKTECNLGECNLGDSVPSTVYIKLPGTTDMASVHKVFGPTTDYR